MTTTPKESAYIPPLARLPRWLRPGTLDSYLLAQTVPPFAIAISVVLIALLLERLLVLLNVLASAASPYSTLVKLLADLLPHYMGLALPAALCVSVFVVVRRMSEGDELDALMSSGVSLARVARPFAITGAVIGVLSMLLYGYLQPHARYQFREGFYFARHAGWSPVLQSGMFASPSSSLTLTADRVDHAGSHLINVFIRDMSDDRERDITARTGTIRSDTSKGEVQIELFDGSILTVRPGEQSTVTTFDHAVRLISRAQAASFRHRGDDERELTSHELASKIRTVKHGDPQPQVPASAAMQTDIPLASLRAELNFRLARSLSIPFIPVLAVSLAIIGKRKRSSSGLAVAVLVLVTYDHILQMGESLVASGKSSPFLVIWPPTLVFCGACVLLMLFRGQILPIRRVRPAAPRESAAS
ncbi:LptF/LptG family permease [Acetobacter estunensis]|uniref:LptF/LptG family permease n=1 Tax=Acetobacter estunensis TaxID=104097 RepID=UPI001C2CCAE1|nr:LptF/LptG family permease [Acetobacter estunensis]MBV1837098.1 LptF/LptG family permease [Acetobacter estunensis]